MTDHDPMTSFSIVSFPGHREESSYWSLQKVFRGQRTPTELSKSPLELHSLSKVHFLETVPAPKQTSCRVSISREESYVPYLSKMVCSKFTRDKIAIQRFRSPHNLSVQKQHGGRGAHAHAQEGQENASPRLYELAVRRRPESVTNRGRQGCRRRCSSTASLLLP